MHFPWADVTSIQGFLDSPQLNQRDFFVQVESPKSGKKYKFPGAPCKLSRSPWRVGSRVPAPGEHNMDIYCGEMGLSGQEMESLVREGVI